MTRLHLCLTAIAERDECVDDGSAPTRSGLEFAGCRQPAATSMATLGGTVAPTKRIAR